MIIILHINNAILCKYNSGLHSVIGYLVIDGRRKLKWITYELETNILEDEPKKYEYLAANYFVHKSISQISEQTIPFVE